MKRMGYKKERLERGRRGMAWLLSASMLLSSASFATPVFAQEEQGFMEEDLILDESGAEPSSLMAGTAGMSEAQITVDAVDRVETPDSATAGMQYLPDETERTETECMTGETENMEALSSDDATADAEGTGTSGDVAEAENAVPSDAKDIETPDAAFEAENAETPDTPVSEENTVPSDVTFETEDTEPLDTVDETELIEEPSVADVTEETLPAEDAFLQEIEEVDGLALEPALLMMALQAEEGTLQAQINEIAEGAEGTVMLDGDRTENLVIPDDRTVTLDLNGHTLSPDADRRVGKADLNTITVYGTLIIRDGSGSGGAVANHGTEHARGVAIGSGGSATLESGAISGFRSDGNGGGVYVENHGAFAMTGGTISGNTSARYGGGIYAYDGSRLSLGGGCVTENSAVCGGGVAVNLVSEDRYALDGASTVISQNEATSNGGGFYLNQPVSSFTIATPNVTGNCAGSDGGGIYLADAAAECVIADGADIAGNCAGRNGGGIWTAAGTRLTMTGGSVRDNWLYSGEGAATHYGGGIYLDSTSAAKSSLVLSGGVIFGNTTKDMEEIVNIWGGGFFANVWSEVTICGDAVVEKNTGFTRGGGGFAYDRSTVRMEDGSIRENVIHAARSGMGYGGGLYVGSYCTVTMSGGSITGNRSEGVNGCEGGGIYSTSSMTMSGGVISGNQIYGAGGGIYGTGTVMLTGNARIAENAAQAGHGGGVHSSTVIMEGDAVVEGNTASSYGGGVYGTLTLRENGCIRENTAGSHAGGAFGTVTMEGGRVERNLAKASGGAFFLQGAKNVLSGGVIAQNEARSYGGGIYQQYRDRTLVLTGDVRIEGNRAANNGGGIYLEGNLSMDGGTVTGNHTDSYGGGIYSHGYTNGTVGKIVSIVGGLLCDNVAEKSKGGHDLFQWQKENNNEELTAPKLVLAAPESFALPSGQRGTAWYEERTDQSVGTGIEESVGYGAYRAYTFRYGREAVARLDGTEYPSVQAAVDVLQAAAAENTLLAVATIVMLDDSTENVRIPSGVSAELDLAGHTLKGLSQSVVYVEEGASLVIDDSSEQAGGAITGGSGTKNQNRSDQIICGGGLFIQGAVTLKNGHIRENNAAYGAGVYVGATGSFRMEGGYVEENSGDGVTLNWVETSPEKHSLFEMVGGEIRSNTGCGVKMRDKTSEFHMSGGVLAGNARGVYVQDGGTMFMDGGSIRENKVGGNGGGVCLDASRARFVFTSGEIRENEASGNGGGVWVNNAIFEMPEDSRGVITGNHAYSADSEGGGIYGNGTAELKLNGGQISGNFCERDGNDIYAERANNNSCLYLFAAAQMGLESVDSWYNETDESYLKDALSVEKREQVYALTAAKSCEPVTGVVARIGEGESRREYERLQDAVADASEGDVIFLLSDHSESVVLDEAKAVTVDLNGYTLRTGGSNIFYIKHEAAVLTLRDSAKGEHRQEDAKVGSERVGGLLTPEDGNARARAVYVYSGTLNLEGVTASGFGDASVLSTIVNRYGGAVYGRSGCSIHIKAGTVLSGNYATYGGAVGINGRANYSKGVTLTMDCSVITGNQAVSGGGIYLIDTPYDGSTVTLKDSEITENSASANGGGLYIEGWDTNNSLQYRPKVLLDHMKIQGNQAEKDYGGAYIQRSQKIEIVDSSIVNNTARGAVGGIGCGNKADWGQTTELRNTVISGNRALTGNVGGGSLSGIIHITDCTVTENRAEKYAASGGGLSCSGDTVIDGSTKISGNYAYYYGGISAGISGNHGSFEMKEGVEVSENTCMAGSIVNIGSNMTALLSGGTIRENQGNGLGAWNSVQNLEITLDGVRVLDNSGRGVWFSSGSNRASRKVTIKGDTQIAGNQNGGVYAENMTVNVEGGRICGNTVNGSGGGIYTYISILNMSGGEVTGNSAKSGGGIYIQGINKEDSTSYGSGRITGGLIAHNTATENGGGIYNSHWHADLVVSGGEIRDNKADGKGGGLYMSQYKNSVALEQGGKIFRNTSGLGQDVYAAYDRNQRATTLRLIKASGMFAAEDGKTGVGWLDEERSNVILDAIAYLPVIRSYALTLQYETAEQVAKIRNSVTGEDEYFTSVQLAVNALRDDAEHQTYGENPVIVLVKNANGNVRVPGSVKAALNLNGYTLKGNTTALTVYGALTIQDEKDPTEPGDGIGTITGNAPECGGGILVRSGGSVRMESGQIKDCHASGALNSSEYGGAGVCVDGGSFELTGTASVNHCRSSRGAAVMVKGGASSFLMSGGMIEENTASMYGAVFVTGGSFRMTGGEIRKNQAAFGGALYLLSGKAQLACGAITDNTASSGGGAIRQDNGRLQLGGAGQAVIISGNRVTGNLTTDPGTNAGGGIYVTSGTMTIGEGAAITSNTARRGGALYESNGVIQMTGGCITENTADYGGGLAQHPRGIGSFKLSGGQLYNNVSSRSGSGNDIYSLYEGKDAYPGTNKNIPKVTLIPAVSMGHADYNAWKDDNYEGTVRTAEKILEGQFVTGKIVQSYNLQLTADHYGDTEPEEFDTTMRVESFNLHTEEGIIDGTASFDTEAAAAESYAGGATWEGGVNGVAKSWSSGKDSSKENGIVRTFDAITYKLVTTIQDEKATGTTDGTEGDGGQVTDGENGSQSADGENGGQTTDGGTDGQNKDRNLRLWMEVELPLENSEAEFVSIESMENCDITEFETPDGEKRQRLRGCWEIANEAGTVERSLTLHVKAMKDGDLVTPVFRQWIEGNQENEENPSTLTPTPIRVSATDQYNVTLLRNSTLAYTSYFNLVTGEEASEQEAKEHPDEIVYGTMLGYGITLSLRNGKDNKLKGIQLPAGDIKFDLHLQGSLYLEGKELTGEDGAPVKQAPYIWAYKENADSAYGTNLAETSYGFHMDWNDEDDITRSTRYAYAAAPFNNGGSSTGCYSGGVWSARGRQPQAEDTETVVHFTVNGYTVSPAYEDYTPNYASSGGNQELFGANRIKPFSAGYIQVLFPVDPSVTRGQSGYLEINMEGIVSDLKMTDSSGRLAKGKDISDEKDSDLSKMQAYFGASYREHTTCETLYLDNFLSHTTGLYIYNDGGNGDSIDKTNYFNTNTNQKLTGKEGTGTTPLGSQVYIGADVSYGSRKINTSDPKSGHYIAPEEFDPQKDNLIEYNYMTGMNLLQKFDADAYTPVGAAPVINEKYDLRGTANTIQNGAFKITTTESATTWSKDHPIKTLGYTLTILYAAKPDGTNWVKDEAPDAFANRGGEGDMVQYHEENLLYFETLQELYDYFGGTDENGEPKGTCVAILYQFRDCCIRTGRGITVTSKMNVTNEFADTGKTFCTTNDVRMWTTYRPDYKEAFAKDRTQMQDLVYQFNWTSVRNGDAYGLGAAPGTNIAADGYDDSATGTVKRTAGVLNTDSYVKTEYEDGSKVGGTHTGWRRGNTLLVYTLDSSIGIQVSDIIDGSSDTPKSQYYLSKGERTANFVVTPSVSKSSAIKNHELVENGSQPAEVQIQLTLPMHLNFKEGSIRFDTEGSDYKDGELFWDVEYEKEVKKVEQPDGTVTEVETGVSYIRLRTTITDISRKLPKIRYTCTIGNPGMPSGDQPSDDAVSNENLRTVAKINTAYEEINQIACNAKTDYVTIQAVREKDDIIYIDTIGRQELGEDLIYYLHYKNNTADTMEIGLGDVLPYNGDGRGTSFTGGYEVNRIRITFSDEKSYQEFLEKGRLQYTKNVAVADESTLKETMGLISGTGAPDGVEQGELPVTGRGQVDGKWVAECDPTDLIQVASAKSGIALYADFPRIEARESAVVEVALTPKEKNAQTNALITSGGKTQQGGNQYWDNFFYQSNGAEVVLSNKVSIDVVERSISGRVWMDQNQDGKYVAGTKTYPSSDRTMKAVDVYLYAAEKEGGEELPSIELGGRTWYQAVDVLGNPVTAKVTTPDGFYSFERLKEGSYMVVFRDDGDDYAVTNGTRRLEFGRLSTTKLPEHMPVGSPVNRARPDYGTNEDGPDGAAGLVTAYADNDGLGISLPNLMRIQSGKYVSGNWNCGLYYIDQFVVKEWRNVDRISQGTEVIITQDAAITSGGAAEGADTQKISLGETDYVFRQVGEGKEKKDLSVTGVHSAESADLSGYLQVESDASSIIWELEHLALQAEGKNGPIQYSFRETAKGPDGTVLKGFVMTDQTRQQETGVVYTAINAQIRYDLDITKISLGTVTNPDGTAMNPTLQGAEFTLYSSESCTGADRLQAVTTGKDGKAVFRNLLAGTYYVKETKAPKGYSLNNSVFKLAVMYEAAEDTASGLETPGQSIASTGTSGNPGYSWKCVKPVIRVSEIVTTDAGEREEISYTEEPEPSEGQELSEYPGEKQFRTDPNQDAVNEHTDPGKYPLKYSIAFRVADASLYTLPQSGSVGILWNTFAGVALMLTALLLMKRRRGPLPGEDSQAA